MEFYTRTWHIILYFILYSSFGKGCRGQYIDEEHQRFSRDTETNSSNRETSVPTDKYISEMITDTPIDISIKTTKIHSKTNEPEPYTTSTTGSPKTSKHSTVEDEKSVETKSLESSVTIGVTVNGKIDDTIETADASFTKPVVLIESIDKIPDEKLESEISAAISVTPPETDFVTGKSDASGITTDSFNDHAVVVGDTDSDTDEKLESEISVATSVTPPKTDFVTVKSDASNKTTDSFNDHTVVIEDTDSATNTTKEISNEKHRVVTDGVYDNSVGKIDGRTMESQGIEGKTMPMPVDTFDSNTFAGSARTLIAINPELAGVAASNVSETVATSSLPTSERSDTTVSENVTEVVTNSNTVMASSTTKLLTSSIKTTYVTKKTINPISVADKTSLHTKTTMTGELTKSTTTHNGSDKTKSVGETGSLESTFGRYGMLLFIGVSALAFCLLCIVICLCVVLRRRKGRKDITKGEKSIPTLKMLEVRRNSSLRENKEPKPAAQIDELPTYSLDYEKHVQEKIEEHRKLVRNKSLNSPHPDSPAGVSSFKITRSPSAASASKGQYPKTRPDSQSGPNSPLSPTNPENRPLLYSQEEPVVFNFAKRPGEATAARRGSALDATASQRLYV